MKRIIAMLLALVMALSLAACGAEPEQPHDPVVPGAADNDTPDPVEDESDDVEPPVEGEDENPLTSVTNAIDRIWEQMPEDFKPMTFGGDYNEENQVENAAGIHNIGDGSELDSSIGFPAVLVDKISEAAAMRHMMNVNSFTCGAYYVNDAADVQSVADGIESSLMNRSYLCGAPQWLVVMVAYDHYVINAFGAEDIINAFKDSASAAYGDKVTVLIDETMEGAHGDNGIALGDIGVMLG